MLAETLRKDNLELSLKLQSERVARLMIQEAITGRSLFITPDAIARLKRFAGTPYFIEIMENDREIEGITGSIEIALKEAEWKHLGRIVSDRPRREGIVVETRDDATGEMLRTADGVLGAARELTEYLEANRIEILRRGATIKATENSVLIRVGLKPRPVLLDRNVEEGLPDDVKQMLTKISKEQKERMERLRKERGINKPLR